MWLSRLPVRARLVAGFALAMIVVLAGAGAFVFWRVQYALDQRLDDDLRQQTSDLRRAAASLLPAAALHALGGQAREAQLFDARGRLLASGDGRRGLPPLLTPAQARSAAISELRTGRGNLFSDRGDHLRVLAVPVRPTDSGRAAVVAAAALLDQRDETLRELLLQLALANLTALALASLVGYRLARGALDPVERYRAEAERIAQGATGVRLQVPPRPHDEISRLGATLNAMLAAQDRAAARQQQFVDDASHELRTPLSALAAEVDLALRRPRSVQELTDALRRIEHDTGRLVALADELLTLGALSSVAPATQSLVARRLLEHAADRARTQILDGPTRIVLVDSSERLLVRADPALIERALGNLVDNAVRHGAGTITLSAHHLDQPGAGAFVLRVHDQGTELDAEFLPRATERFARNLASRTGSGTGLGMSLVDAIAATHNGQLRICAGGAHHLEPTTNAALASEPCRHPESGTTMSLLLPGDERWQSPGLVR